MALRLAASTALVLAAQASAAACPGATNPMIAQVTVLAPKCFEACPEICAPLGSLIDLYMEDPDEEGMKKQVCAEPEPFKCFFASGHFGLCKSVLEMGKTIGVELPMSEEQLEAQCEAIASAPGRHHDLKPGSSEEGSTTGAAATTAQAVPSAAVGRLPPRALAGLAGLAAVASIAAGAM